MSAEIHGTNGLILPSGGGVEFGNGSRLYLPPGAGTRNILINGGMQVDQQNGGASVTISSTARNACVDGWYANANGGGQFTADQSDLSAGDNLGSRYGVILTTSTADASVAAGDYYQFAQAIEGRKADRLRWGTATARRASLQFRCAVSASMVGRTFSGSISNGTISFPFSFTPSASYQTFRLSIPGPTTGTWVTTVAEWGTFRFNLGCGSNLLATSQGTAASDGTTPQATGTWQTGNFSGATGTLGIIDTLNAWIVIKDVQLEAADYCSEFEMLDYDADLWRCMRYLQYPSIWQDYMESLNKTTIYRMYPLPVFMRVNPTPTVHAQFTYWTGGGSANFTPALSATVDKLLVQGSSLTNANGFVSGTAKLDARL